MFKKIKVSQKIPNRNRNFIRSFSISIITLIWLTPLKSKSSNAIRMSLSYYRPAIEVISGYKHNDKFENFYKTELNILFERYRNHSISIDLVVTELRGSGTSGILVIIALAIFISWNSVLVNGFLQHPLPHMNIYGWLSGK